MKTRIQRSADTPRREGLSRDELWEGDDDGLILNWEIGRERGQLDPELASRANRGELPPSPWKGGVARRLKTKAKKYAPLRYLAEWQGLRGEDLDICLDKEVELTCARTGVRVTYTHDYKKYGKL